MEYVKPSITPIDSSLSPIQPMSCTVAAVVLALIIAVAGAYVGVGVAYAAGAALAVGAAAWYAAVGAGCVSA